VHSCTSPLHVFSHENNLSRIPICDSGTSVLFLSQRGEHSLPASLSLSPCWKNSSKRREIHWWCSTHGLQGWEMSAICNNRQSTLERWSLSDSWDILRRRGDWIILQQLYDNYMTITWQSCDDRFIDGKLWKESRNVHTILFISYYCYLVLALNFLAAIWSVNLLELQRLWIPRSSSRLQCCFQWNVFSMECVDWLQIFLFPGTVYLSLPPTGCFRQLLLLPRVITVTW